MPSINMQGIFKAIIDKGSRKSYYQEMAINLVEKNYKNVNLIIDYKNFLFFLTYN